MDIQIKPTKINGKTRYCVRQNDAPQVKGFKGKSSGIMFHGCYTEKGAAEAKKSSLESGRGLSGMRKSKSKSKKKAPRSKKSKR